MSTTAKVSERPRYFPRQLITPGDMSLEQEYFRYKMRRHNQMLHGWGVVCGAKVCYVPHEDDPSLHDSWRVEVKPGYLLSPQGDEIDIAQSHIINLKHLITGIGDPTGNTKDPWCSEISTNDLEGTVYLAVQYLEKPTRLVPVPPSGCGTSELCEHSRWLDCYEFKLLNDCPKSHQNPPNPNNRYQVLPDCSSEPTDSWIVLACIEVTAMGIVDINNCKCRRLVAGSGAFWWQCDKDGEAEESLPTELPELSKTEALARLRVTMRDSELQNLGSIKEASNAPATVITNISREIRAKLVDISVREVAEMPSDQIIKRLNLGQEHLRAIEEVQARAIIIVETIKRFAKREIAV